MTQVLNKERPDIATQDRADKCQQTASCMSVLISLFLVPVGRHLFGAPGSVQVWAPARAAAMTATAPLARRSMLAHEVYNRIGSVRGRRRGGRLRPGVPVPVRQRWVVKPSNVVLLVNRLVSPVSVHRWCP